MAAQEALDLGEGRGEGVVLLQYREMAVPQIQGRVEEGRFLPTARHCRKEIVDEET